MKALSKITALLLAMILAVSAIPVYAADSGKFISLDVECINEEGNLTLEKESFYSINNKLYVPVNLLTKYTPYYYNSNTNAFIRTNQPERSAWGQVEIDYDKKGAVLKLNIYNKKTYKLSDIYKFGNEYFLPLDEMAALLKSEVKASDKTLRIVNSGYSLADAEYAFTLLESKQILNFDMDDIVDDVYAGNDNAFKGLAAVDFLGSLIIGLKLENIIIADDFGSMDNYYDFFEKCSTDNDSYIEASAKQDDLIGRFAYAQKINKVVYDGTKQMGKYFGIIRDVVEPYKYSDGNSFLLYTDSKDMKTLYDILADVTEAADFVLKVGSMCEDNKNMIVNLGNNYPALEAHVQAYDALKLIEAHYGQEYATNISSKITSEILREFVDQSIEGAFPPLKAVKIATTIIDEVSKAAGYNITSNKEINLMVNVAVKHILNNYFFSFKNYSENEKSSEEYRTAVIFFLLTCKHLYIEANEAAKETIHEDANLYENEIKEIEDVLGLFYSAVQSKKADNFKDIEALMKVNAENIKKSNFNNASSTTQGAETSEKPSVNTNYKFVNATKEDFKELEENAKRLTYWNIFDFYSGEFINSRYDYFNEQNTVIYYSYKDMTYKKFMESHFFITDGESILYSRYFGEDIHNALAKPDPLNKFNKDNLPLNNYDYNSFQDIGENPLGHGKTEIPYYIYDVNNIDWIIYNIFNIPKVSADEHPMEKINSENYYFYKDKLYAIPSLDPIGATNTFWQIKETKQLKNKIYTISFNMADYGQDGYDIKNYQYKGIAGLKEIDGKKYWSWFYLGEENDVYREILKDFS